MSGMWYASFGLLAMLSVANAVLLVGVMRQVGVLHERLPPVGALEQEGPDVGRRLPRIDLQTLDGSRQPLAHDRTLLLAYVMPGCGSCDALVPIVERFARLGQIDADFAFATDAPTAQARSFAEEHVVTLPMVRHDQFSREYEIKGSPYVLALHPVDDRTAVVLGGGVLHTLEQLEDVAEQVTRNKRALLDDELVDHSASQTRDENGDGARRSELAVTVADARPVHGRKEK